MGFFMFGHFSVFFFQFLAFRESLCLEGSGGMADSTTDLGEPALLPPISANTWTVVLHNRNQKKDTCLYLS